MIDATGFRYYAGSSEKDRRKVLGQVSAASIMAACEIGLKKKKQDFCFEVSTKERNWYFWALDGESMKDWIAAFETAKSRGRPQSVPVEMPDEKRSNVSLSKLLPLGKKEGDDEEEIDYISSIEEDEVTPDTPSKAKKSFVELPYTGKVAEIEI